ncbi:MAG: tautomerase family protein [Caldilineaceae bacterium]|nr:tautomerase family protein [Caldilineaceae bacterium]
MSQVKIYGYQGKLNPIKARLSDVIHSCVVEALHFPPDKRAHRFFPLAAEDFYYPDGRTDAYTIIEIMMISGRTVETKKRLVRLLFDRIAATLGIAQNDLEICITESPATDWGFRGMHGDEIKLTYQINV